MPFNLFSGDPQSQAMLALTAGLLESGGPSRMPVGVGQGIARGMMSGREAYMAALEAKRRQEMVELARQEMLNRTNAPQGYGPGTHVFRPGEQTPFYTVPFKPEPMQAPAAPTTRKIRVGNQEVTQEWTGQEWREVGRGAAFSDKPLVSIENKQEGKFTEEVGKAMGEQYAGLLKSDMSAPATIAKYQRLGGLLSQVNTGKFRGTITDMKATAKSMGFDLSAMGIPDDVAPAQAARALSNQIALELRNPAGGAGMPGALSDKDREFLLQSIPGLENDPAAIGKMIEYRVKLAQREQQVAKMAREYRKKHGKFDEGFYDELKVWSDKNPLFPEASNVGNGGPQKGEVVDGYEFLGGDPGNRDSWRKK